MKLKKYVWATCFVLSAVYFSSVLASSGLDTKTYEAKDIGKIIDARNQNSYYSKIAWLMREDNGRIDTGYCASGQPFSGKTTPDWSTKAPYATDKINFQYSDNNGTTWSTATNLIKAYQKNNQEDLSQAPCASSLIFFQNKYYLYFESYTKPSNLISIYVAKADTPGGPYSIWTNDGWQKSPTQSIWKPVLKPNVLTIPGGEKFVTDNYSQSGQGNPFNLLYGAGIPRVTEKNGSLYLYYLDTTYYVLYPVDDARQVYPYNDISNLKQFPYQLVATSSDPTNFENSIDNRLRDNSGKEIFDQFQVKYSPADDTFVSIYAQSNNGSSTDNIIEQSSNDGITFGDSKILAPLPNQYDIGNESVENNNTTTGKFVSVISDKFGHLNLSDLFLGLTKKYNLDNGPFEHPNDPYHTLYYGDDDIYAIRLSPKLQRYADVKFGNHYNRNLIRR